VFGHWLLHEEKFESGWLKMSEKKDKQVRWKDLSKSERMDLLHHANMNSRFGKKLTEKDLKALAGIDAPEEAKKKVSGMGDVKRAGAVALIFTMITVLSDYYDSATRADNVAAGREPDYFGWNLLNPLQNWRTWGLIGFAYCFFFVCYKNGIAPEGGF